MTVDQGFAAVAAVAIGFVGVRAIIRREMPISMRKGFRQYPLEPQRGTKAVWGGLLFLAIAAALLVWATAPMFSKFQVFLDSFAGPLSAQQRTVLAVLVAASIVAGAIQGFVIRRALRDASGLRRFAGWGWDIRMLQRSFYPESGQHLYPAIVQLYVVSMGALLVVFLLLARWVIF